MQIFREVFGVFQQNFDGLKNWCCPRAEDRVIFEDLRLRGQGQELDLWGQGQELDLWGQGLQNVSSRTPPLMLSNISRAPVGVTGKANEIVRQASLCNFESFLTRYRLLRRPTQEIHRYDMIGRIMAVYIHFIIDGFVPHVLPTICLHWINTVVALRVIRVICSFQVSLLSRVTSNSFVSFDS